MCIHVLIEITAEYVHHVSENTGNEKWEAGGIERETKTTK